MNTTDLDKKIDRKLLYCLSLLFSVFLIILSLTTAYSGVYVPPPKLRYKYTSKYRSPFEPMAPGEEEAKLPEPPAKYRDFIFNSDFYLKLNSPPPPTISNLKPRHKRRKVLENLPETEPIVKKTEKEKHQLTTLWILTGLSVVGIGLLIAGMYLSYRRQLEVAYTPPTYTKYAQTIDTPRRRRRSLLLKSKKSSRR